MFSANEAVMRRDSRVLRAQQGKVSLCETAPGASKGDRAMAGLQNDAGEGVGKRQWARVHVSFGDCCQLTPCIYQLPSPVPGNGASIAGEQGAMVKGTAESGSVPSDGWRANRAGFSPSRLPSRPICSVI
jgi:hypothetical protein